MTTNILAHAAALSNQDLLTRLDALAGNERDATVELLAHLAALDMRPGVYAAQGFGSLFSYCTQALRLSEDATCNRIEAARACRRFPEILDLIASGSMSLTSVRLLGRYLTPENHHEVLARARARSRREIDVLIAELAPRPDVPTSFRKLPAPRTTPPSLATPAQTMTSASSAVATALAPPPPAFGPTPRPIVQASAPERYRIQFTIGQETHDRLRRVQDLLRREIPDGDPGAIFDRALTQLLDKVERTKLAATTKPQAGPSIRRGTDKVNNSDRPSRHVPREVARAVWRRDASQ